MPQPSSAFSTGQVSVGTAATQIVGANASRQSVVITNLGTQALFIGPNANVTALNGMLLPGVVGASITIFSTSAVWGISAVAQSVSFLDGQGPE